MSRAERIVKNWTDRDDLEVSAWPPQAYSVTVPALVNLIVRQGSLGFQHGLLPTQARQMAVYLTEMADVAEAMQAEWDAAQGRPRPLVR